MSGWYKQTRGWSARPWFKDANLVQLYCYLKDIAYVQPGMYKGILVRRGSCPTSRPDMMEATGLTYKQVDRCLKLLIEFKEILVKGYYNCTIVTICDYDSCNVSEDLFALNEFDKGTTEVTTKGTTEGTTQGTTTPINIKEERRIEDNLRSKLIPSKNERESKEALVREIKDLYNRTFNGILPEWQRLSDKMVRKVDTCMMHYGRQSVDMVFDQIRHEQFSLGENKTGFIADFQFIFRLDQYEGYLSRYKLRMQKQTQPQQKIQDPVGAIDAHEVKAEPRMTPVEKYTAMITLVRNNPRSACVPILKAAYDSGELAKLGLDWKPNNA